MSKMTLKQLGNHQSVGKKSNTVYHVEADEDLAEIHDEEDDDQHEIHAATWTFSTLGCKKKRTYTQTLKAKKHHELARGYSKPPSSSFHAVAMTNHLCSRPQVT